MNLYKYITIIIALTFTACNTLIDDEQFTDESPLLEYQGVSIGVSQASTRTALDPDDMASVEWLSDDCIYLWAKDAAGSYTFSQAEFKQKYFFETYSHAVFTSLLDPMSEGTYDYFGVYPKPASVSGSVATYELSSEQSGLYDGELDIMAASPVSGGALGETPTDDLALSFSHMTHALRINIPEDRNLFGQGVRTLEVTFPGDVVGNLSFDAASSTPTPTLSSGSSVVTLSFEEALDEGDYAWIFIAPGDLSGTLSFRAYGDNGYKSAIISVSIDKTMEAGKITPITLTVPDNAAETVLNLSVKNNYLGEDIESMTITAPSGAQFVGGATEVTLPYDSVNGCSVSYYADDYGDLFNAGSLSITYESEHAIVSGTTALSGVGIVADTTNSVPCDVPYLFEEDFSTISSSGSTETSTSTIPGLTGWVGGDRSAWWSGKCVDVRSYSNFLGPFDSRMNSATFESFGLKSSASVSVLVMFDSDWCKNESSSMSLTVGRASSGNTDAGDTISASSSVSMTSASVTESSTFTNRKVTISGCESSHRIVWETNGKNGDWFNYDHVYIDNVKVQIAN